MVGEAAVGGPVEFDQVQAEPLEQGPHHRAGHAVAAVHHDLQALWRGRDYVGVDEAKRGRLELLVEVDLLERPARRRAGRSGRARNAVAGRLV